MERLKGTIVGFGFLSLALCLKSVYSGENAIIFGFGLIFIIVVPPIILSHKWKIHKSKV